MHTELISIPTATTPLDGVFYAPDGGASAGAVLFFHGNTMNFYVGAPRFLPPALTRARHGDTGAATRSSQPKKKPACAGFSYFGIRG